MEGQKPWNNCNNIEKNKAGSIIGPDVKDSYFAAINRRMEYWQKTEHRPEEQNKIKEIAANKYVQLCFDRGRKSFHFRKIIFPHHLDQSTCLKQNKQTKKLPETST